MSRPVAEVVRSQAKMIDRRGSTGANETAEGIAATLHAHREESLATMRRDPRIFEVLEIDYPTLVADPALWAAKVAEFIGPDLLPHPERMAGVVRGDLHRNRSAE